MEILKYIDLVVLLKSIQPSRPYIGASSIGNSCHRAIWYGYKAYEQDLVPINNQITFDIGKVLEDLILSYLEKSRLNIERATKENDYFGLKHDEIPEFQGHIDALLHIKDEPPIILEIKSAKNSSFNVFKNKGLKAWSKNYYYQVQSYMGLLGLNKSIIIVINKDTSEILEELVLFDPDVYFHIIEKVKYIKSFSEPPPRLSNQSSFYVCARCHFRTVCHYNPYKDEVA